MMTDRSGWVTDDQLLRNMFMAAGSTSYRGTQTTFLCPRIILGTDALLVFKKTAPAVITTRRALVITDQVVRKLAEKVAAALEEVKFEVCIWDEVLPEPPVENVRAGAAVAREFGPGLVVAVGGGSVVSSPWARFAATLTSLP